jgi:hypothetical protein
MMAKRTCARVPVIALLVFIMILAGVSVRSAWAQEFGEYTNNKFKFSTRLPRHWVSEIKNTPKTSAIIFSGPKDTEEYYTTINLQVTTRQPKDTLKSQAQGFAKQLATAPKYKILSLDEGNLAGQPAVRIKAVYQGPGTKETFKQDQVIAEKGAYFYWIGYTAPEDLFEKYAKFMEQAIGSFKFLP